MSTAGKSFTTDSLPKKFPTFCSSELFKKFFNYIKNSSWKFANIDFVKGYNEFRKKIKGQVSRNNKVDEIFVSLFSNNVDVIYENVKDLNFSTPKDGGIFYSGEKGKKAAWLYAYKIGSKAIEQTMGGSLFEYWDWFNEIGFKVKYWGKPEKSNDQAIVWSALSKAYANKVTGIANVFQEYEGNIWRKYEKFTLESRGIKYRIHKIGSSTNVNNLVNDLISKNSKKL